MYQVQYSDKVITHIQGAYAAHPQEVQTALLALEDNPLGNSLPTGAPALGEYYIEAAHYAIVFNVDRENEVITIVSVRKLSYIQNLAGKLFR